MYQRILVPIDLGSPELNTPALDNAAMMAKPSNATIRLITVLPMTPMMLAEYVPPDFEAQQRKTAEAALAALVTETGFEPSRISATVRQGGIYQEILDEATSMPADLIVMTFAPAAAARGADLFSRLECRPRRALRPLLGAGGAQLTPSLTAGCFGAGCFPSAYFDGTSLSGRAFGR